jgi:lysophospholipase L1-like esterase
MTPKKACKAIRSLSLFAMGALVFGLASCTSDDSTASGGGAGTTGGSAGSTSGGAGDTSGGTGGTNGAGGMTNSAGGAGGASGASATGGAAGTGGKGGGGNAGASGAAGAADAGPKTDAGNALYNPCPTNGDACRVMPLGDSITDGCCGENTLSMGASYRLELFHLSLMNNKKITFVGSNSSGPNMVDGVAFPKKHEGHSGWTIANGGGRSGLQEQIVGWLNATPPDIVTLMIGTNDVDIMLDLPNAPKRLGTLIDTITQTAPKALVVVAQIVPTQSDAENVRDQAFNGAMPALVKTFTDAGKHVMLVDMYSAYTKNPNFKTALLANGLHPSDAGYAVMANVWWDAIGTLLPGK